MNKRSWEGFAGSVRCGWEVAGWNLQGPRGFNQTRLPDIPPLAASLRRSPHFSWLSVAHANFPPRFRPPLIPLRATKISKSSLLPLSVRPCQSFLPPSPCLPSPPAPVCQSPLAVGAPSCSRTAGSLRSILSRRQCRASPLWAVITSAVFCQRVWETRWRIKDEGQRLMLQHAPPPPPLTIDSSLHAACLFVGVPCYPLEKLRSPPPTAPRLDILLMFIVPVTCKLKRQAVCETWIFLPRSGSITVIYCHSSRPSLSSSLVFIVFMAFLGCVSV